MSEGITVVLNSYGTAIKEKLGYVVRDNASNNHSHVKALGDDQVLSKRCGLPDDSHWRHRNTEHDINIVVKAL
jgi:hypothetical protein